MENKSNKSNKNNMIVLFLSLLCFLFIIAYMFLQKGITDFTLVLCYFVSIVLPMYNILNNKDDDIQEIIPEYFIASISSICIIIYTIFSVFSTKFTL